MSQSTLPSNNSLNQQSNSEIPARKESVDVQDSSASVGPASGTLLVRVSEIMGVSPQPSGLPYVLIEVDKNEVVVKASSSDSRSVHLQQKATL